MQPYKVRPTIISSPGRSRVQIVEVIAPMPDASANPASPPSSEAMRCSSRARVGLEMRL
ncbi:hypothetical protein D3C81_2038250 [compost metagenome]